MPSGAGKRPGGAGKRQCRVSVLSFRICLTRFIIGLLFLTFMDFFLRHFFGLFLRSLKPKNQNRLIFWGKKSSIFSLILVPGEGRKKLSSEKFLSFLRTETSFGFCVP